MWWDMGSDWSGILVGVHLSFREDGLGDRLKFSTAIHVETLCMVGSNAYEKLEWKVMSMPRV